jgi:preprotein translocase subunit SecF
MLHDALFVLGVFSILGHFFGVEIDALFITALLTVIGFSVHDTIVVFDRIRENLKLNPDDSFEEIVNHSVGQTLVRSVNTSITVVITLLALLLFGGSTTREFVLALLIGTIAGTYSSIFNASQLLVAWQYGEIQGWFRKFTRFGRRPVHGPSINEA